MRARVYRTQESRRGRGMKRERAWVGNFSLSASNETIWPKKCRRWKKKVRRKAAASTEARGRDWEERRKKKKNEAYYESGFRASQKLDIPPRIFASLPTARRIARRERATREAPTFNSCCCVRSEEEEEEEAKGAKTKGKMYTAFS